MRGRFSAQWEKGRHVKDFFPLCDRRELKKAVTLREGEQQGEALTPSGPVALTPEKSGHSISLAPGDLADPSHGHGKTRSVLSHAICFLK